MLRSAALLCWLFWILRLTMASSTGTVGVVTAGVGVTRLGPYETTIGGTAFRGGDGAGFVSIRGMGWCETPNVIYGGIMLTSGIGGISSRLSIDTFPARTFRSTRELGRGVRVGVTGFGPYDIVTGSDEFSRAAWSSSFPLYRCSGPPQCPICVFCEKVGEWGMVGEWPCVLDSNSSYPIDPGKPSKTCWKG